MHKAKGLEWDVVFIPALERMPGTNRTRLLNWAEVGSPDDFEDNAAHIMLAPIPGRGEESKSLNTWLRRVEFAREAAERKRLFYVACTRAREELHLFASPETMASGDIRPHWLSLLKSAWPAAQAHFQLPAADAQKKPAAPGDVPTLALAAVADWPRPLLQRLPPSFDPAIRFDEASAHKLPYGDPGRNSTLQNARFLRPEGSFAARSFGNVVHICLDLFSDQIGDGLATPAALLSELPTWTTRIAAMLRSDGLPRTTVDKLTRDALATLERVLRDPDGLWLLAAHSRGDSELAITAWTDSAATGPTSIRMDRVFHAGPVPQAPGEDFLWIVDYKTSAHSSKDVEAFLTQQRTTYGSQLETYAGILAPIRSVPIDQVRLALYFPTLPRLIWWKATDAVPSPATDN
jgi:hypothetical protein